MINLGIVLLILIHLLEAKIWGKKLIEGNVCAQCSRYLMFCKTSRPGYITELWDDIDKVVKFSNITDNSLAACIDDRYRITALLEGSACFWSPELGCHKILGRRDQERGFDESTCVECLTRCPCGKTGGAPTVKMKYLLICLNIIMLLFP